MSNHFVMAAAKYVIAKFNSKFIIHTSRNELHKTPNRFLRKSSP